MLKDLFPSMFARRVLLLSVIIAVAGTPLVLQMGRLTLANGEEMRARAESKLRTTRRLHNPRGSILDRKGRPLAVDSASYDIAVDYDVITGHWAFRQAAAEARLAMGGAWRELSPLQRLNEAETRLPTHQARLETCWVRFCEVAGISREALEARRSAVILEVSSAAASLNETERRKRQQAEESLARSRAVSVEVATADVQQKIAEETQPHVILHQVSDDVAFAFQALVDRAGKGVVEAEFIPGLRVVDSAGRDYPFDSANISIDRTSFPGPLRSAEPLTISVQGVTTHIVGTLRKNYTDENQAARQAELKARSLPTGRADSGAYRAGDRAGRSGIEFSAEFDLRGQRGSETIRLDTGDTVRSAPRPGENVQLTIDAMLQARVLGLLDPQAGLTVVQPWHDNRFGEGIGPGTPLAAAVVVLDIDTSDILALVSTPPVTRVQIAQQSAELAADQVGAALVNKCINRAYPPGSIVKPLVFCAAASAGAITPDTRIPCNGHLFENQPERFRCWTFKQFKTTHNTLLGHDPDGSDAIMGSCNIFFYSLGRSLGPRALVEWYGRFGVGAGEGIQHPRLGIGPFYRGIAGEPTGSTSLSEATLMGIGQGPLAWTPLHAADAYATIARGGVRILPRLKAGEAPTVVDLGINRAAAAVALDGLRRAVSEERGTGHHITFTDGAGGSRKENIFNAEGITVWGKSGTADAPAILMTEVEDDGTTTVVRGPDGAALKLRDGDHAWLVCMAGRATEGRPRLAIAVCVEYGGSGGKVAGPIANQVIRALMAEGYL